MVALLSTSPLTVVAVVAVGEVGVESRLISLVSPELADIADGLAVGFVDPPDVVEIPSDRVSLSPP